MKKLFYIICTTILVVACANIGSPDGGPYDETPPRVVRTSPKIGSTKSNATRIVIEFDENVKLDNATENVIISPPQIEQPEIDATGKKITIRLLDSIKPETTYTIDFSDAIKDNNESNSMGDYAFTFSTGETIDSMQVSGYVLDASNLEPVKGIVVGVYALPDSTAELPDSVFKTKPLERVSRTDASGHFVIKGLNNGYYKAFAVNDQNQNFIYDQNSEMVAFLDRKFKSTSKPDVKPDTVWHDSIHYDSIIYSGYTHYYPDDLTLTAFTVDKQDRQLLKKERPQLNMFTIMFSSGSDTLPKIKGLNFDAENAFIVDATEKNDTLNYWIRDSLIYNIDTLEFVMDYYATDTTGTLVVVSDTSFLASKISREKVRKEAEKAYEEWAKEYRKQYKADMRAKEREDVDDEGGREEASEKKEGEIGEEGEQDAAPSDNQDEVKDAGKKKSGKKKKKKTKIDDADIPIPPMPEEFMEIKMENASAIDPDKNVDFIFPEPLDSVDMTKMRFYTKRDSLEIPEKFIFKQVPGKVMTYRFYAEWQPDSTYFLECDTGMFVNIYGKRSASQKKSIKVGSLDTYSTLFVVLQGAEPAAVVELLNGSDKVVKTLPAKDGKADFYFIKPGTYYLRMFNDRNGNGKWDTGNYDEHLQAEEVYYYHKAMELKANWEITENWHPKERRLFEQKPLVITKQKDEKKDKTKKSKNQQRLEDKLNAGKKGTRSGLSSTSGY